MTREEAIAQLKMDRDLCNFNPMTGEEAPMNEDCRKSAEALDMAIKALEQEPCEDAVNRQAVCEFLENHAKTYDDVRVRIGLKAGSSLVANPDNVPSVTPAPKKERWIPCSERLPERGKDVLVTRDYDGREDCNKSCRYVEIASRYGEDDDPDWKSFSDEYKIHPKNHHVIAWRELPEPYREESQEE